MDVNTQNPKQIAKGCLFLIVGVGVLFVFFYIVFPDSDPDEEKPNFGKTEALIQSQNCMEKYLKSPGSAEWCYGDHQVVVWDDTTFYIRSCVDSQNSFGGLMRTNYSCKIIYHPATDFAECEELKFDQ